MGSDKIEKPKPTDEPSKTVSDVLPEPQPKAPEPDVASVPEKPQGKKKVEERAAPEPEKPKPTQPTAKKDGKEKEDWSSQMNDYHEQLGDMVKNLNGLVTEAVGNLAKTGVQKAGDAFKKTELGQACGKLSDELSVAKDRVKQAIIDKADDKLDELASSKAAKVAGEAVGALSKKVDGMKSTLSSGLVGLVNKATESVKKMGSEPELSSPSNTKDLTSGVKDVTDYSKVEKQQPTSTPTSTVGQEKVETPGMNKPPK